MLISNDTAGGGSPVPTPDSHAVDSGLLCLVMLARFHGIATDPDQLAHECGSAGQAFSKRDMLLAATTTA